MSVDVAVKVCTRKYRRFAHVGVLFYLQTSPQVLHASEMMCRHDAAKDFILAAHHAGISFDDLALELGDAAMLTVLFKDLGLEVPSSSKAAAE